MLFLPILRRSIKELPHFTALVRFVEQPILVLCFNDFLLDAVDNAKRDEQVMAVGTEILSGAVEAPSALCRRAEEGLCWVNRRWVVEEGGECLMAVARLAELLCRCGMAIPFVISGKQRH